MIKKVAFSVFGALERKESTRCSYLESKFWLKVSTLVHCTGPLTPSCAHWKSRLRGKKMSPSSKKTSPMKKALKRLIMDTISCVEVLSMGGPWGWKAPYCPDHCGERWAKVRKLSDGYILTQRKQIVFVLYTLRKVANESSGVGWISQAA